MAKSKSSASVKLDGSKMAGSGSRRVPEGDYKVKVAKAERTENKNSGNQEIKLTFDILDGPKSSGTIIDYLTLTEKALFRVGNFMEAIEMKYPKKVFSLPLAKVVDKELGVTVADDEWNGKIKSKVADYLDLETITGILEGADDEEEDEDEGDGLDDMSRKELKAYIEENDLDVKVKKAMSDEDIVEAIREEEGDEDEDEDDDEDEELDEFDVDEEL